ncbi:MAG: hypothetical protein ACK5TR_02600 [Alphaproteobacteria bacterium]|nr:hypothetical protein [Alphaproteobacteria bacterium]
MVRDAKKNPSPALLGLCLAPSHFVTTQEQKALTHVFESHHLDGEILINSKTLYVMASGAFKEIAYLTIKSDVREPHGGWYAQRETDDHYPLYLRELSHGRGVIFSSHSGVLVRSGLVTPCLLPTARAAVLQQGAAPQGLSLFGFVKELLPGHSAYFQDGKVEIHPINALEGQKKALGNVLPLRCEGLPAPHVPLGFFSQDLSASQFCLETLRRTHGDVKIYSLFFPDVEKGNKKKEVQDRPEITAKDHELIPFTAKDFWRLMPEMAHACDELICQPSILGAHMVGRSAVKDGRHMVIPTLEMPQKSPYFLKGYVDRLKRTTYQLEYDASLFKGATMKNPHTEGALKALLSQGLRVSIVPVCKPFLTRRSSSPYENLIRVWIQEKNHRLASLMARQECILELMPREEIKDLFVQRDKKSLFVAWELIFYALWHQIYIQGRDPIPDTLAMLART